MPRSPDPASFTRRPSVAHLVWIAFGASALLVSAYLAARALSAQLDTSLAFAAAGASVVVLFVVVRRVDRLVARRHSKGRRLPGASILAVDPGVDSRRILVFMAIVVSFAASMYVVPERLAGAVGAAGIVVAAFLDQLVVASHPRLSGRPKAPPRWGFLAVLTLLCLLWGAYTYATW